MSNYALSNFVLPETLFTLQLAGDDNETLFRLEIGKNLSCKMEGDLDPIEAGRQFAQMIQLGTIQQLDMEALDHIEEFRKKVLESAKRMSKEELIEVLESDLFFYYLSGSNEGPIEDGEE